VNELTFILALLLEKEAITPKEFKELHSVVMNSSLNNSGTQMLSKVQEAIRKANTPVVASVQEIDAKDLLK
jgi:hypothetical protein